ncbi:MAG: hypothetical protein HUU35_09520, partial [Armatimonadetes bacterium]|nr:hypothetical protein [Armatimonadota bacterium]
MTGSPFGHQRGGEAIPWQREFIEGAPWSPAATNREAFEAAARAAVLENIERGLPVEYGSEENGLIVGASSDGQRWLCLHPYHKDGRERFWHDEVGGFAGGAWPWFIGLWREPKPAAARPSAEALRLGGLKQAVAMWSSERVGDYLVGEAAYDHWLTWLRGIEDGAVEDFSGGLQGNGWVYAVLHHSR